jgi:hypothetical protein
VKSPNATIDGFLELGLIRAITVKSHPCKVVKTDFVLRFSGFLKVRVHLTNPVVMIFDGKRYFIAPIPKARPISDEVGKSRWLDAAHVTPND